METQKNIIEPTNKSHRILFTAITILLTAGVIGGSVWYGMNQITKEQNNKITELEKGLSASKTGAKTETKKEEKTAAVSKDETANWKTYTNESSGLTFKYPQEWGNVSLKAETPAEGTGFQISFSSKKEAKATIRSKDYNMGGGGRGGAYWDAPAVFSNKWEGDVQATGTGNASALIEKSDKHIASAYCSEFLQSAGLEVHVKLEGQKYDNIKFYYLVKVTDSNGNVANLNGCSEDVGKMVKPLQDEFIKVSKTAKIVE